MIWQSSRESILAFVCWLITVAVACAQTGRIEVHSPSAKLLDTTPGRIVTASVVVGNHGSEADEFVEQLTLPPGCQKVAPPDLPFRLDAGAQTVRILAVQVPSTMPAGRFDLRYSVQGRRDPSSLGSVGLAIQVLPVDGLELIVDPHPDPAIAGDNYPVHVHVLNHGNSRLIVQIHWRSSLRYQVTGNNESFTIEPGETHDLLCRVETDRDLSQQASHAVTFDARAVTASGKVLTASRASVVELIPLISGDRDPFHRIPMQLKLTTLAESGHASQFQAELSGSGTLDEAGRRRVDFLFRGPDIRDASLFGEHDEYGASYHDDHWDVNLGDRIYELSPLTELHGFGRGAGVTYHDGPTMAGAFYMTTLRRAANTEEFGTFVKEQISTGLSVQSSLMRKQGGDLLAAHALPQSIFSFASSYQHGKELDLQLEYGVSHSDSGKIDFGYRADAKGQLFGRIDYAFEHVYAGPIFHGYDNDTRTNYATVVAPLGKNLRARASLNEYSGNLDLNPELSSVVNREKSWSGGMVWTPVSKTDLSLDAQHVQRQDILLPAAYDFTENSLRFGAGQNFGKLQLQSFLDAGTLENRLTGENGPFQRYSAFLSCQPTPRQSYSIFGAYGPSASSGSSDKSLNAGISAHVQFPDNFDVNASYARNQFDSMNGGAQDQAMGSVRYRFANHDEVAIVGRWIRTSEQARNESAVMVTITHPLSLAVSKRTSIGGVRGRISVGTEGVSRAVVMINGTCAVTDTAGNFEFPGLKPGKWELRVLTDTLAPDLVMSTPLPMKVNVRSAETVSVRLEAVKAATVSVRVTVFDFADGHTLAGGALKAAGGFQAGTVELTDGHNVLPIQTDRLGEGIFERVPCGRWSMRIRDDGVPAHHFIEQPEQSIELKSGETRRIEVRILPRKRTLQMIDRGAIQ